MITPVQASKIVNKIFEDAGVSRSIPPQMMYNYGPARVSKGKTPIIQSVRVDGKWMMEEDSFNEWLVKYMKKAGIELAPETNECEGQLELIEA